VDALWRRYASWRGRLYGVYFKVADKSVVWYQPALFRRAGIKAPPATWDELLADAAALRRAGITPFAMCGASGWTLTDWFENLYLQTAGPNAYQALAAHAPSASWRDPSVAHALGLMAAAFAPENALRGATGIVSTDYPACVNVAFSRGSGVAMVMEGDFVQNEIRSLDPSLRAGPNGDFDFFRFPAAGPADPTGVVVGGDVAVMLRDTPEARALIQYLSTRDAGSAWVRQGGFISPHRHLPGSDYPNAESRALAAQVTGGPPLAFDMSDQAPALFGSTVGQGEWADLQQWLAGPSPGDPAAIRAVQDRLERDAEAAYPSP